VNESRRSPQPSSSGLPGNRAAATSRLAALEDADAPLYTVGQAAEVLGTQPAALRRLDAAGVIVPGRTGGGQRRYSRHQLHRALRIQDYVAGGASTALAGHVVDLEDQVSDLAGQVRDLTDRLARAGRETAGTHPAVPNPREGRRAAQSNHRER
jgi:MerR family transcriptional regulator/heat shock protein HspR